MTTNSTWAALRNPAFRRLWIAALISGTCMVAHDTAATWVMNILTRAILAVAALAGVGWTIDGIIAKRGAGGCSSIVVTQAIITLGLLVRWFR